MNPGGGRWLGEIETPVVVGCGGALVVCAGVGWWGVKAAGENCITGGGDGQKWEEERNGSKGKGRPDGRFDCFGGVAEKIGHALGLGHITTAGIMNGGYTGELTELFSIDIDHITSVYGVTAVPLPAGVWLLGSGLLWLFYSFRGRRESDTVTGQLVAA